MNKRLIISYHRNLTNMTATGPILRRSEDTEPLLVQCRSTVYDAGPKFNQHYTYRVSFIYSGT